MDIAGSGYLHAHFHGSNPLARGPLYPILDRASEHGRYADTYLAWGAHNPGWGGEGKVKFYLDGDDAFPAICGTGTEDHFGGAWDFEVPGCGYTAYGTPYLGLHQILRLDGLHHSQQRFGTYRWHVADPIHFDRDSRVDVQAPGWASDRRYRQLADDIASVAHLYLDRPASPHPRVPGLDDLEVHAELPQPSE